MSRARGVELVSLSPNIIIMGDAALPKPHILVAFFRNFSDSFLEEVRNKFPDAEVSNLTQKPGDRIPKGEPKKSTYL